MNIDIGTMTDNVLSVLDTILSMEESEQVALYVSLSELLADKNRDRLAKLLADIVVIATYGPEEQREAFIAFAQAFALSVEAIARYVKAESWLKEMSDDRSS